MYKYFSLRTRFIFISSSIAKLPVLNFLQECNFDQTKNIRDKCHLYGIFINFYWIIFTWKKDVHQVLFENKLKIQQIVFKLQLCLNSYQHLHLHVRFITRHNFFLKKINILFHIASSYNVINCLFYDFRNKILIVSPWLTIKMLLIWMNVMYVIRNK